MAHNQNPFLKKSPAKPIPKQSPTKPTPKQSTAEPIPEQLPTKLDCKHCNNSFESQIELQQHMLKHSKESEYNCDDCAYQENSLINLENHLKTTFHKSKQAPSPDENFPCNVCGIKFTDNNALLEHKKT